MAKATGLGQGVNLLFGEDDVEKYFTCDIDQIIPNKHQPRNHFQEESLQELADSIKENGIIQPLVVTNGEKSDSYELIAGERRLRASKLAGLSEVPVVLMEVDDDDTLLELALVENIQRTDLNPLEEAEAYSKLIEKFGYTQEETAKRVGKKRSTVSNSLRLLNLPGDIKEDIVNGLLSEGHGRALLRIVDDPMRVKEIRDIIIQKQLSVRQTEKLVKKAANAEQRSEQPPRNSKNSIPGFHCTKLVSQLTSKLSSKVNINQNGTKGKLEIEYHSPDDLERLISIIMDEK